MGLFQHRKQAKRKKLDKEFELAYDSAMENLKNGREAEALKKMKRWSKKGYSKATIFLRTRLMWAAHKAESPEQRLHYKIEANKLLQTAADQGDAGAQFQMGRMYEDGDGVPVNADLAFQYYELSAKRGYRKAQNNLGRCYSLGLGTSIDLKKAVYWFLQAANQGNPKAQLNMGYHYQNGRGVDRNMEEAGRWFEKAIQTCNLHLNNGLTAPEFHENDFRDTLSEAYRAFEDLNAQRICYELRNLPDGSRKRTLIKETIKNAEAGNWPAQFELGLMYDTGGDLETDYKKALYWYTMAANNGSAGAMHNIGTLYLRGEGVGQSYELAYQWFMRAIKANCFKHSFAAVGWMYENGYYVSQSYEEAAKWYEKGAAQEQYEALCSLGHLYEAGKGVERNYKKAVELYESSAKQGYRPAQTRLDDLRAKELRAQMQR